MRSHLLEERNRSKLQHHICNTSRGCISLILDFQKRIFLQGGCAQFLLSLLQCLALLHNQAPVLCLQRSSSPILRLDLGMQICMVMMQSECNPQRRRSDNAEFLKACSTLAKPQALNRVKHAFWCPGQLGEYSSVA